MSEAQAHQFLSKCESRLLWRKVADENEVIEIINRNFRGVVLLGMFSLSLATWNFLSSKRDAIDNFFLVLIAIFAVLMVGFSIWILIRMRQVRHVLGLECSQIVNQKS